MKYTIKKITKMNDRRLNATLKRVKKIQPSKSKKITIRRINNLINKRHTKALRKFFGIVGAYNPPAIVLKT